MYAEETFEGYPEADGGDRYDSFAPDGGHLIGYEGRKERFNRGKHLGRREILAILLAAAATGICAGFDLILQDNSAPED